MNIEIVDLEVLLSFRTTAYESQDNRHETSSHRSPEKLCVRNPLPETRLLFSVM